METLKIDQLTLDSYVGQYFTFDKPVPFLTNRVAKTLNARIDLLKQNYSSMPEEEITTEIESIKSIKYEFLLNPIMLEDGELFSKTAWVFQIKKESVAKVLSAEEQIKIISASNLSIVSMLSSGEIPGYQNFIETSLAISFGLSLKEEITSIRFEKKNKSILLILNDTIYIDEDDWDKIRKIICYQNIVEFSDKYVNPEIQEELDKINALKSKQYKIPSIENRIAAVCVLTGMLNTEVNCMTYRRFCIIEQMSQDVEDYRTKVSAMINGAKFKDGELEHYLYKKDRGLIGFTPLDDVKSKFK